jgi:type I restriction enzyme S subunit
MIDSPFTQGIKLKAITTKIGSGATPRGGKNSYKSAGITLIRSLNVYDFEFSLDGLAYIDEKQAEGLANVTVKPNDILLNITGASVARCCMVPNEMLPARVNQHVALVRVDPTLADAHYVMYCLISPYYKNHLLTLAQGGATREALTKTTIEDFEIPYPPLDTQHKIAAILSAYDDLIENNTRRIAALEAAARALYREWFVEFRFPGHESVEWVESELGWIPAGWEWVELGDLVVSPRDSVHPNDVEPTTPYVGLAHIPQKSIALYQWGEAGETVSTKLVFKKGDILFAKIRPYLHKVAVAPLNGVCSSDTIIIRPRHPGIYGLVLQTVFSEEFVGHADTTSQGTNMPRANWDVLVQYPIPRPPNGLLNHFNNLVQDSIELIGNMIFRNRALRNARDQLLPRLISGELSVENVPLPDELDRM